ncbi:hypothetical protein [Oharaeibacter diazotrophicus]|uniref:Lipoprotein n=1 Tax=Oharaeibacter diazotrophicus TaxID=1920512 RepID=A0A4R6RDT5_9HYPH|nr:hypothetical protein [Oharaeibacter diazotrophicus]TDP84284.1 hypothetical protein EDD54_2890 [Oharaeibacter diazotrophicus]BBE73321.1 hypothetical protein OHA_1_02931 [Pleomorphomonas sp. SM30]GLS75112.1 hypothetical protein GCM10007904_04470 [Oharaeibacter diazotrophicus]
MVFKGLAAVVLAASVLAGCVATDRPTTDVKLDTVEASKRDIAALRDRGAISFEEAARRQFAIQRNFYALTDGEYSFWRASIEYARDVDARRITPKRYRELTAIAYHDYVVLKKPGKPIVYSTF